ncbi:protease HtpX [Buchnera aphidicola]|uniref:Protease HtpX n=1 Tax=Buchnera aphidicola (Therioaphis trifolii) TaxID=1241884 RepID=A0A4D6YBA7_9GAMM|nr:protease HtpX [Buchnera aphidicola]QCI27217.1 protease HtpX [Buchnera aphidicola (Therioaphis trifolii)]
MIRVILFLITNLSVTFMFGTVLFLTGIESNSIRGLIIFSSLVGFTGSITSLFLSKWSALRSVNARIIDKPQTSIEVLIVNAVRYQSSQLGIKTPEIAIYESNTINAFATGYSQNNSVVAFSTKLIKVMDKEDLQSVIAHELSHIVNGDMVTLALIQGVINTFIFFVSTYVSRFVMNILITNRNSNYVRSYGFLINYVISMFLQAVFGMFASIIVMAFSRYREFRADADAAKRIGWDKMIKLLIRFKEVTEPQPPEDIKTYCINGQSKAIFNLFASHPPVQDRIDALHKKKYE